MANSSFSATRWPWMATLISVGVLMILTIRLTYGEFTPEKASPTLHELNMLVHAHHYHQALRQVTGLLNLSAMALQQKHADCYDLQMIRADVLLHLRLFATAIDAYQDAASATTNFNQSRPARGWAALVGHSPSGFYSHQHTTAASTGLNRYDIVPKKSRRQAMHVFYDDEWTTLKPRVVAALHAVSLDSTVHLFAPLRAAVDAEAAANENPHNQNQASSDADLPAQAAVDSSTEHIITLVRKWLKDSHDQIKAIQSSANTLVVMRRYVGHLGVTQSQTKQLQQMVKNCRYVMELVHSFKRQFPDFPKDCTALQHLTGDVQKLQTITEDMLR